MVNLLTGAALALAGLLPAQEPVGGAVAREPGVPFEELVRRAETARAAGHAEDALRAYAAGVDLNPLWEDGWWQIALLNANARRYPACRDALGRLLRLAPRSGPGWALSGVCEFRDAAYERALASLVRGVSLGLSERDELGRAARYHLALLLVRKGEFGTASGYLQRLVKTEAGEPEFQGACGLMALRSPRLPSEIGEAERPFVLDVGRTAVAAMSETVEGATRRFEDLVARYPKARGVHLAYALFLSREGSAAAVEQLKRELELFPDNAEAHLEFALELLDRGDAAQALASARAAAASLPQSFWARLALGRALVAGGSLADGIVELERAEALAPEAPEVCLALAQAYARAGRTEPLERVRAKLRELERKRRPPTAEAR